MDNLTPDAAVNAVSEKLGLNMETNQKQVAVYVTASLVLNGFLDIFTGTADVASLLSGVNLQAFSLAQIKQMTVQINKNVTTLMESDGKAAWDHFKRGEFKEAHDMAIKGFHSAPNKIEAGIPIKLMCTRIKLMTELIRKYEGFLFLERSKKTGLIIQTCLNELLDDPLVKELWKRATNKIHPSKSSSLELIYQIGCLVGGCYATMSHCLGLTFPDRKLKDGEIARLNTKYLPLGKKNRITVPISQHLESFSSMEVFKEVDKVLHLTITVTDSKKGVHQKYEITEENVNAKPLKFSIWALKLKKNQYSLSKITDKDPTSDELSLEYTNENTEPKHRSCEPDPAEPGRPIISNQKEEVLENAGIPNLMDLGSEAPDIETKKKEEIINIEEISEGNQTTEKKNNDAEEVEKIEKCKQEEGEIAKPKQINQNQHEEIIKEKENQEDIDENDKNHYKSFESPEGSKIHNVLDSSATNGGETKMEDLEHYGLGFEEYETENNGGRDDQERNDQKEIQENVEELELVKSSDELLERKTQQERGALWEKKTKENDGPERKSQVILENMQALEEIGKLPDEESEGEQIAGKNVSMKRENKNTNQEKEQACQEEATRDDFEGEYKPGGEKIKPESIKQNMKDNCFYMIPFLVLLIAAITGSIKINEAWKNIDAQNILNQELDLKMKNNQLVNENEILRIKEEK